MLSVQVDTEERLEDGEVEWDTQWVNDETGASQEVEWFVEDDDKESADEVHILCMASPSIVRRQHMKQVPCQ